MNKGQERDRVRELNKSDRKQTGEKMSISAIDDCCFASLLQLSSVNKMSATSFCFFPKKYLFPFHLFYFLQLR